MSSKRPALNTYSRIRQALHWIGALAMNDLYPLRCNREVPYLQSWPTHVLNPGTG